MNSLLTVTVLVGFGLIGGIMGLASDSRDYAAIKNKTSRSLIIKEYEKKMLLNLYNPLKIKKNNKIKDKNTASSVEEIKMTLFDDMVQ